MNARRLDFRSPDRKRPRKPRGADAEGRFCAPAPAITVYWAETFRDFCAAHRVDGGGFVQDGDVLLFGDGWSCALDHRGPYFQPPRDVKRLHALLVRYWRRRGQIVRGEAKRAADTLEGLNELRRNYPLPLVARRVSYAEGPEGVPYPVLERDAIDWTALAERLRWLNDDALNCEARLIALGERP